MIERARLGLGVSLFQDADFLAALEQFEQAYKVSANSRKHAAVWSGGLFRLIVDAWTLWVLGYPDRAMARSAEALAITAEIGVLLDVIS